MSTAALAGTGAVLGLRRDGIAAEPPPETTKLRLIRTPAICQAPQSPSEELLRSEGNIISTYVAPLITRIDLGDPFVILTGLHVGCFELFGTDRIRAIRDLKGKIVNVSEMGGAAHLHLASILSYVGFNPAKDVIWVMHPAAEAIRLLDRVESSPQKIIAQSTDWRFWKELKKELKA